MKFNVPDMSCGHCKSSIEKAVNALDTDAKIDVDLAAKTVAVQSEISAASVSAALEAIGFATTTASS